MQLASIALALAVLSTISSRAAENAVQNGDFADGVNGWSELANDADRTAVVIDADGGHALQLTRKTAKATALAVQYNIKFKPQTVYRLSVEYRGDCPAAISFRASSSKEAAFFSLVKSYGVTSCPLPPSKEWKTETLLWDSGALPDSAFLNVRLDGEQPGACQFRNIALTTVESNAATDELIVMHIGDSITLSSYLPFSERVNALLDAAIQKEFPKLKVRNINMAADGEYVKELLETKRYEKTIKDNYKKIDIAIIRYGGNDSRFYPPAEFKKQLGLLSDNLKRDYPGVQILIGTGTYLLNNDDVNLKQYGPYWQALRDFAAEQKFPLIDVYKRFEAEKTTKTAKAEGDMHPSAFGVQLIAETVFAALKPILAAKSN